MDEATLSATGLTGITLYEPAEMVVAARAGTPLAEVEALLAERGQMLPFEPMDHRPLLGSTGEPTFGAVADFVVTLENRTKLRPRFFCRITPGPAWS